jgi:tRNA-binding protein
MAEDTFRRARQTGQSEGLVRGGEDSPKISFEDLLRVDVRIGRIVDVQLFPRARKPAYQLRVDFGPAIGERRSSAQLTQPYSPESLLGRQVLAVINFPPRQIANFSSGSKFSARVNHSTVRRSRSGSAAHLRSLVGH